MALPISTTPEVLSEIMEAAGHAPASSEPSQDPAHSADTLPDLTALNTSDHDVRVDTTLSDADSAIDFDIGVESSSTSLAESMYDFVEENGRTYHSYRAGAYHLPNDKVEQGRLDLQHQLFLRSMDGKLYAAPLAKCESILDIATGTGLWAVEVAQQHPEASVIGTDLSPIQPNFTPPNVQFFVEDCEDDWTFTQKFDLVHGRALASCFTHPKRLMASIFDSLNPGGYVELQDIGFPFHSPDGTLAGTKIQQWQELMIQGMRNLDKDIEKVSKYSTYLSEAGFVDIVEKKYVWALGPWVKDEKEKALSGLWQPDFLDVISGASMTVITRGMGWSKEDVETLLEGVKNDVLNWRNVHAYLWMHVVYGRKPE